jgi:hypothetical protein
MRRRSFKHVNNGMISNKYLNILFHPHALNMLSHGNSQSSKLNYFLKLELKHNHGVFLIA